MVSDSSSARTRIAKAAQKLRDEAARTLAREAPPQRPRPARPLRESPPPPFAVDLHESERAVLVEVTDQADQALLCMPPEEAMRQRLRLRLAAVAARTRQNKVILHRRRDARLGSAGTWDLYTGFVMVGEAREDAAIRLLETGAIIGGLRVVHVADREDEPARLALFVADLPAGVYPAHPAQELLEADADELRGLVRDAPELFSPELIWAEASGMLFR
ncbi:MAG: NUDIX hydrolase [Desulfovibrionaceae bacterium]|nr:NUDIX hydrolase [Desulfovibrionaceae bacterium]